MVADEEAPELGQVAVLGEVVVQFSGAELRVEAKGPAAKEVGQEPGLVVRLLLRLLVERRRRLQFDVEDVGRIRVALEDALDGALDDGCL